MMVLLRLFHRSLRFFSFIFNLFYPSSPQYIISINKSTSSLIYSPTIYICCWTNVMIFSIWLWYLTTLKLPFLFHLLILTLLSPDYVFLKSINKVLFNYLNVFNFNFLFLFIYLFYFNFNFFYYNPTSESI